MSLISATDPLALLAIQAGQVDTPATESGAAASRKLDVPQRAAELGEPVPIVFCRRRNSKGGVLISPGATEARFENDATNNVTAYYHLVLSEGQVDSIPVKDVFQRSCRVGSHSQTYNRRAGTWTPGNAIVVRAGYTMPECPYYCGSVGAYTGMSTLSFQVTIPDGFDQWNRQVHAFIRGGMRVTRLQDGVTGASDSFVDLIRWAWVNSSRVPSALIDTTALKAADDFLEINGFTCNCWITESQNVSDVLAKWAPYFLLGVTSIAGKKGLKPLLPVNANGTINTGAIVWKYEFNENTILPDSLEIQYTSLVSRLPFAAQVTWRQQLEDDFGIIRTAQVRYNGTAASGPYESHDLSEFCTNEAHAVKYGAYVLSKRINTTHAIRFTARAGSHNSLSQGDIVRVRLSRNAAGFALSEHDYLYQIERITKTLSGQVSYECCHFPITAEGKSVVALDVAAATGTGILIASNKTGVGCDLNSSTDNTIPAETWSSPDATVTAAGAYSLLDYDPTIDPEAVKPKLTSVLQFLDAVVEPADEPGFAKVTISATCNPTPINKLDGLDVEGYPVLDPDFLEITLNVTGLKLIIAPLGPGATATIGTVVFNVDISEITGTQTVTVSATAWKGGGFDEMDISDTITYTLGSGPTAYRIQAEVVSSVLQLNASGLSTTGTPTLAASGGPFGDPIINATTGYTASGDSVLTATGIGLPNGTSPWTVELWFQRITYGSYTANNVLLMGGFASQYDWNLQVYHFISGSTGRLMVRLYDTAYGSSTYYADISLDTWHHVAITLDGSGTLRVFLDGSSLTPDSASFNGSLAIDLSTMHFLDSCSSGLATKIGQTVVTPGVAKYTANFTPPSERI